MLVEILCFLYDVTTDCVEQDSSENREFDR